MVRMSIGRRHSSVILLLVVLALAAMTLRTPGVSAQGTYVFGTQVQLVLYGVEQDNARRATNAVFARLNQMHAQLHAWRPSDLTRLNAALAGGAPFQASPRLANMLREAQRLSRLSGGLFDPGIGRLIRLWGFQADQFAVAPPSAQAVNALENQHASLNDLDISPSGRIRSSNPGVALDLGGYAKGWSLDEAAVILKRLGVKNALIDVGGNLLALGSKGDEPWRVGVQNPRHPGSLGTRPFCKYLCPLGAGLAIPSWLRLLPLRRKPGCATCHACAVGCGSQAIDEQGRIDQKECLMCLDCMVMYYDEHSCPPLSQERKRRLKAGEPLTEVDKSGDYIPIKPL